MPKQTKERNINHSFKLTEEENTIMEGKLQGSTLSNYIRKLILNHTTNTTSITTSTTLNTTQKTVIRGLIAFLNEIKNTFFIDDDQFNRFVEILKRHTNNQDLADLEASL